jgi:glycosyltransferase involved in cell wall biosynthesis
MNEPLVSVILCVLNGARYIREAIASVQAQNHRSFELIVVDDGSTDATAEIVSSMAVTMLIRRSSFLRVGGFKPGLKIAEWLDWGLRAQEAGLRSLMLNEVLLHRRIHGSNSSFTQIDQPPNLVRAIKESLDRRRAASESGKRG